MTFNPCADCGGGTGLPDIGWLVLVWLVPTVLFALRRQLPEQPILSVLRAVYWFSVLAAVALTLNQESEMGSELGLGIVVPCLVGVEVALCCLAVLAVHHSHMRSGSSSL
jgi:hypothetical protein